MLLSQPHVPTMGKFGHATLTTEAGEPWKASPNTYCSKSGGSVPLNEDSTLGFDVTLSRCRAQCARRPACKMYSFGRWTKGIGPVSRFHGRVRCQLYARCSAKAFNGMTVFHKPESKTERNGPPMYLLCLPTITNCLVFFCNHWARLGFMVMIGFVCLATSTFWTLRQGHSYLPELLSCTYLANAMVMFMIHSADTMLHSSMAFDARKRVLHQVRTLHGSLSERSSFNSPLFTPPIPTLLRKGPAGPLESSCDEKAAPPAVPCNSKQPRRSRIIMDLTKARGSMGALEISRTPTGPSMRPSTFKPQPQEGSETEGGDTDKVDLTGLR